MGKTDVVTVDQYIASYPKAVQSALACVRRAVLKAVPGAEERISYKMPSYQLHGDAVLTFAGWKTHYSLYFASQSVVAAFGDELARYKVKKGTVSFPLSEPVPVKLIERIAKFRAEEVAARGAVAATTVPARHRSPALSGQVL